MTPASTASTTLLKQFGLTTAAEELVPRLTQAGHHDALTVLVDVFEAEAEARRQWRIARLRRASRLPLGKTFETLDTGRLPGPVVQELKTLATGAFLETATNVLAFGLPGVGKSHALCAVAHALVEAGHSVSGVPAYALVQELLGAKRDLDLPRALCKLDLFEVILLDDLGYVQQGPDEAEVLFTLLAERYERRSVMVTSNLVFSQWDRIFRDQMATAAAIDRLVHHSVVLEFDVPSFRTDPSRPTSPPSPPPVPRGRPPGPLLPRRHPGCELLSVSDPEAITASTETFTAHIFSRARVATTSPSLRKPRARLPHSVNVPKRTFTPFGLLRLQNPQQRPANGASSKEQPSELARIVAVERQKYLTPNKSS